MTTPAALEAASQRAAAIGRFFGTVTAVDSLLHLPKALFDRPWDPAWYPFDFLPFNPAVQLQLVRPAQIADNADFVCMGGSLVATDPANEATFFDPAPYTAQIAVAATQGLVNRVGTNQGFVHVALLFGRQGAMENRGRWPVAGLIKRNTTMQVTLNVLDAVNRNVRVGLFGFSVY